MADIVNHTAENPNQRLYKTYEEALKSIRDFEIETTTKFVVWRKNKQFGCKGHKVVWHERAKDENDSGRHSIGYDGTPFFINGEVILECQHATERHESWRNLQKKGEDEVQHRDFSLHKKRRFHLQDTKKLDCPARIHMKDIVRFIDFKIQKETPHFRKEASKTIRSTIETGAEVKVERRIFVSYPSPEEHKFHPIGAEADIAQQVDTRNIDLIHLKISEGIRNVKEMKRHIKCYVKNYLFKDQSLPAPTNRRFILQMYL
ncbi:calcium-responsive transcription factor-like [Rhopilema esculentum]|uniref:calcium-responsive transcription factor-like n=1 Tax=Rhopilema esculentum TaxID=499914 RepID=UPI0031D05FD7